MIFKSICVIDISIQLHVVALQILVYESKKNDCRFYYSFLYIITVILKHFQSILCLTEWVKVMWVFFFEFYSIFISFSYHLKSVINEVISFITSLHFYKNRVKTLLVTFIKDHLMKFMEFSYYRHTVDTFIRTVKHAKKIFWLEKNK